MQFASAGLGSVSLGSILVDPGASNAEAISPIVTELDGLDIRAYVQMDSLTIDDTLGQPVTAALTLIDLLPEVGQQIKIRYFSQVIFAGTIDHVNLQSPDLTISIYKIDCLDWSQTLIRRKLRRNFTDITVQSFLDSVLDNELTGELLTLGTIDARSVVPLIDARDAKMFDACRTVAGATGQTFYVDYDQSIQMRGTTVPVAPLVLNETNTLLDGSSLKTDRETYRNRQYVTVTGTAPEGQDALVVTVQRDNTDQIAARAILEGGTGIYEEIESIVHPTSNDGVEITLLAIGYANLRLATSGTPRFTFSCQVQGYGFRAGQIATVSLPTFGVSGTFTIQRVSIREVAGVRLFHQLELTNSSLQQRVYEAWLGIVKTGKVTVQVPSAATNNLQSFLTPTTTTWTVPAGVTVAEFTCIGGSGGGGGGRSVASNETFRCDGGNGGNSGKAVSVVNVTAGQVYDVVVGAAGVFGAGGYSGGGPIGPPGDPGTLSSVSFTGSVLCQGNPGLGGTGGGQPTTVDDGVDGSDGSGVGDAISVGGGVIGGTKGIGVNYHDPTKVPPHAAIAATSGLDGRVEVRW